MQAFTQCRASILLPAHRLSMFTKHTWRLWTFPRNVCNFQMHLWSIERDSLCVLTSVCCATVEKTNGYLGTGEI